MSSSFLFRLGKIKGPNGIVAALKHNRREIQQERGAGGHIDPERICLNYSLYGDGQATDIALHAKIALLQAGIEVPRKNAVMGVEIIFSLPIHWLQKDTKPYFEACLAWVHRNMQGVLLAFDVHLDESAPHAHALILPLIDGKLRGSEMVGGIGNLKRLLALFHAEVAIHYGLASKKLSKQDAASQASSVINALKNDPVQKSAIWPFVRDAIRANPLPFAQHLGLFFQPKRRQSNKTFVQIMTSKGHGKS